MILTLLWDGVAWLFNAAIWLLNSAVWLLTGIGKRPTKPTFKFGSKETGHFSSVVTSEAGETITPKPETDQAGSSNFGQRPDDSRAHEANEKRSRRIYRYKLLAGLFLPWWLASTDATIVATALPQIASHFGRIDELNWIVTAYTLTSASFIPAFGQLADVFGRHAALQLSTFCILVGSVLAAASQAWGMLLLGRALQGLGGAGIIVLIQIIIADKVSLADNAKNDTFFSAVAGMSFGVGPVIGGYLTASNWRYCFVLSIPVAVVAHVVTFFVLRKELVRGSYSLKRSDSGAFWAGLASFDVIGIVFFILGTGLIILGITWGGATTYSWTDARILAPLIVGGILFCAFFVYEYFLEPGRFVAKRLPRQTAMIPWSLFEKKDTLILVIISMSSGASLYAAFYFISIYWNVAMAYSPSRAGIQLLYYTPGLGVGVILAMFFCNKFPKQTFLPLVTGSVIETTGMAILPWAVTTRNGPLVNGMMAVAGCGTGLRFMPTGLHTAGIWPLRLASAMSLMDFANELGGTVAISIMSSVFSSKWAQRLSDIPSSISVDVGEDVSRDTRSLEAISALPPDLEDFVRRGAARAVMWAFIAVIPFMALSVVASTALGNVWIDPTTDGGDEGEDAMSKGSVMYGSYLLGLVRGDVKAKRVPRLQRASEQSTSQEPEVTGRKVENASDERT